MAKVFIDSNILFDITERDIKRQNQIEGHHIFVSALSYHILFYTYKYRVPVKIVSAHKKQFSIIGLTDKILSMALEGPTPDLEDNIQLHSALAGSCQYFLTSDKKLLGLHSFGKTKIVSKI